MKVAVLGDIHGNWVAMERVAEDLIHQQVDAIVGLGDYLNTSRGAAPVVEWMKRQPHACFVRGDNDAWECYERFRHQEREDSSALYQYVTQLPERLVLQLGEFTLLAQHGYPWPPRSDQPEIQRVRHSLSRSYIESVVDLRGVDIACFGDLHQVHVDLHEDLAILHPGSVGVPSDGEPWGALSPARRWEPWTAKYLLLELDAGSVRITLHRAPFSRELAVQEVRAAYREDPGPNVWLARHLGWVGPEPERSAAPECPWPGPSSWRWEKKRAASP